VNLFDVFSIWPFLMSAFAAFTFAICNKNHVSEFVAIWFGIGVGVLYSLFELSITGIHVGSGVLNVANDLFRVAFISGLTAVIGFFAGAWISSKRK
jgi:hypothetical protein